MHLYNPVPADREFTPTTVATVQALSARCEADGYSLRLLCPVSDINALAAEACPHCGTQGSYIIRPYWRGAAYRLVVACVADGCNYCDER